jgi:hypothetical protein
MAPTPAVVMQATVDASPLMATYGTPVDPESAREILAKKMNAAATAATDSDAARVQANYDQAVRDMQGGPPPATTVRRTTTRTKTRQEPNLIEEVLGSRTGQTVVREVLRGIFSTLKRG